MVAMSENGLAALASRDSQVALGFIKERPELVSQRSTGCSVAYL